MANVENVRILSPSGLCSVEDLTVIHGVRLPAFRCTHLHHASATLETVVRSESHFIYATVAVLGPLAADQDCIGWIARLNHSGRIDVLLYPR